LNIYYTVFIILKVLGLLFVDHMLAHGKQCYLINTHTYLQSSM